MVDRELLRRKLDRLKEDTQYLQAFRKYSREEFLDEPERFGSAERFLQTSIEATIDAGSHIISTERLGSVVAYRDVPEIFRQKGLIPPELSEKWIRMIGLRNLLVHEYGKIDRNRIHDYIAECLADFDEIMKLLSSYL